MSPTSGNRLARPARRGGTDRRAARRATGPALGAPFLEAPRTTQPDT